MIKLKYFLVLLLMLTITSCSIFKDNDDAPAGDVSRIEGSILDIPSSVSNSSASRSLYKNSVFSESKLVKNVKSASSGALTVYGGIRDTVGGIEDLLASVEELMITIDRDLLKKSSAGTYTDDSLETGKVSKVVWGEASNSYDTFVDVYYWDGDSHEKCLETYLTFSGNAAKGLMTWNLTDIADEDDVAFTVEFDGIADTRYVDVKVISTLAESSWPVDDAVKLYVYLSVDRSENFALKGTYFINDADFFDTTQDRAYSFIAAGYTENYADPALANHAALKLAVPVANYGDPAVTAETEAAMWSNFSVGQVFTDFACDKLRAEWGTTYTISQIESWTSTFPGGELQLGTDSDYANTMIDADIIKLLEAIQVNDPDNSDVASFLFIVDLVNPAYFISTGFQGTFDGTKGSLTTAPSWASGISLDAVSWISPYSVYNLAFDSTDFIVD